MHCILVLIFVSSGLAVYIKQIINEMITVLKMDNLQLILTNS